MFNRVGFLLNGLLHRVSSHLRNFFPGFPGYDFGFSWLFLSPIVHFFWLKTCLLNRFIPPVVTSKILPLIVSIVSKSSTRRSTDFTAWGAGAQPPENFEVFAPQKSCRSNLVEFIIYAFKHLCAIICINRQKFQFSWFCFSFFPGACLFSCFTRNSATTSSLVKQPLAKIITVCKCGAATSKCTSCKCTGISCLRYCKCQRKCAV